MPKFHYRKTITVSKKSIASRLNFTQFCWNQFIDESYFELTPSVNRQNNRLWPKARPTEGIEHPLYDKKVCAMCCVKGFMVLTFLNRLSMKITTIKC
jgi:hypothetical protein